MKAKRPFPPCSNNSHPNTKNIKMYMHVTMSRGRTIHIATLNGLANKYVCLFIWSTRNSQKSSPPSASCSRESRRAPSPLLQPMLKMLKTVWVTVKHKHKLCWRMLTRFSRKRLQRTSCCLVVPLQPARTYCSCYCTCVASELWKNKTNAHAWLSI